MAAKPLTANKLKILYWNAHGLRDKKGELEELLDPIKVDIICIGKTHLNPNNPDPRLPFFSIYRNDRATQGGGTAIYARNSLDHSNISTQPLNSIEYTEIIIPTIALGPVRLTAVYAKPHSRFGV